MTKITSFHERSLRVDSDSNSKMKFLNVAITGLRGCHHPVMSDIVTSSDVGKLRPAVKLLTCDYYTYSQRATHSGCSAQCRLCSADFENLEHVTTGCDGTADVRDRILQELHSALVSVSDKDANDIFEIFTNKNILTQFILDCSSLNLGNLRISNNHPGLTTIIKICRDLCFAVHKERARKLKELKHS